MSSRRTSLQAREGSEPAPDLGAEDTGASNGLGREAHIAWRASWVHYIARIGMIGEDDARAVADACKWLVPYDDLSKPDRAAWEAGARAAYELGKKDAKEELERKAREPGWAARVGGRW